MKPQEHTFPPVLRVFIVVSALLTSLSAANAQTFGVLHELRQREEGALPYAGLVRGADGRLYGAANFGGNYGDGTIFAIDPEDLDFTVLHHFNGATDGALPVAALVEGSDGRLYGTTMAGGIHNDGTIFCINADGSDFTVVRDLNASTDGGLPFANLTEGADGRLYGTTFEGGAFGYGTIFAMEPDGSGFTVLRDFHVGIDSDGGRPMAGLIEGADGRLYGTTSEGGDSGDGTVFAINRNGSGFTILHHFSDIIDDRAPFSGLIQASDGRLYGSTSGGGDFGGGDPGPGTIFAVNPDGSEFAVLWRFTPLTDGAIPRGSLTTGPDGRLYGTTSQGGLNDRGTLFAINHDGSGFSVLVHFDNSSTGGQPYAGLVAGAEGRLYGTASIGGAGASGTLFVLSWVPEITSPRSAAGQVGQAFVYAITATNNPAGFDALGLPRGLHVDHDHGLISGVPREAGEFSAIVSASNAYSQGFADLILNIAQSPPVIVRQPEDVTASGEKSAAFAVNVRSSTKVDYQWFKDGQAIPGASAHRLMLRKVSQADEGTYHVIVTNAGGSVRSDGAVLTLLPQREPGGKGSGKP